MIRRQSTRRTGSAIVETVLTITVFSLVLFGVMEYCRFLFVRQLVDNAAREGARYAAVNSGSPTLTTDVQTVVTQRMGGMDGKVRNFTVSVYHGDVNGNKIYTYATDSGGNYVQDNNNVKTYIKTDNTTSPPTNYTLD